MAKKDLPTTQAVRCLRANKIDFKPYFYDYQEHGGALHTAAALDVSGHQVVKTLVMEIDASRPLLVLMHGDREVSTKKQQDLCNAVIICLQRPFMNWKC